MTVPNIDTFENDIREEIKTREASVGDIASAGGVVQNTSPTPTSAPGLSRGLFIFIVAVVVIIIGGFGYLGYVYFKGQPTTPQEAAQIVATEEQNQNTDQLIAQKLNKISPALATGVAHYTSKVDVTPYGTALTLKDYNAVFAFVVRNENVIAHDALISEFNNYTGTSTLQIVATDDTKANQNMRILTVGSSTLVYAFLGDQYLVLASTPENILQMRGALVK